MPQNPGQHIRHAKRRGEWAELRFQLRASELGLILARPCGECAPYDFLVACPETAPPAQNPCPENAPTNQGACPERATSDRRGRRACFLRIQVKCTLYKRDNSYTCSLTANHHLYTPDQIDFFAAYVIPADVFYILPLAATNHQPAISLSPHRQKSKYAPYKEAWHLLMPEP
jgi:hypothetical protein